MEQKTTIVIKEEIADTDSNFSAKSDAVDQRFNKVNISEEPNRNSNDHCCTDNVTKIERNESLSPSPPSIRITPTGMNSRNRPSPKCPVIMLGTSRSVSVVSPTSNSAAKHDRRNLLSSPSSDSTSPILVPLAAPSANNTSSESEHAQMLATKNLSKVRRLLSTLLQFAKMLSTEMAETVKILIFNLAVSFYDYSDMKCSTISVEEFHSNLQEVITDFPLRPFVLPFLRNYVPILQKEINLQAKLTKQNIQVYVRQNENSILDPFCSTSDLNDVFNPMEDSVSSSNQRNEIFSNNLFMGKRRHECFENNGSCHGVDSLADSQIHDTQPPMKRHAPSTAFPPTMNNIVRSNANAHRRSLFHPVDYFQMPPPPPFLSPGNGWLPSTSAPSTINDCNTNTNIEGRKNSAGNSEWENINMMLNCILSMVEKTKRALAILQDRNLSDHACEDVDGESLSNASSDHDSRSKRNVEDEVRRRVNQLMAQTIRLTEEKVAFVLRRAEEAVNEVKRRAVLELEKALGTTDYQRLECNGEGNVLKMPHESKQSTVVTDPQSEYSTRNDFSIGDKLRDSSSVFYPFLPTNVRSKGRK